MTRKLLEIGILGMVLCSCGQIKRRSPGTQDEQKHKQTVKEENLHLTVTRPAASIGYFTPENLNPDALNGPELDEEPASIESKPDGSLKVDVPRGTTVSFTRGRKSKDMQQSSTQSYFERVYNAPWWMYAVGVGLILFGFVGAIWLRSVSLGMAAGGAGLLVLSIGVALESYRWMFGILAGGAFIGIVVYVYYVWRHRTLQDVHEDLSAALKTIVTAVDQLPAKVGKKVKSAVKAVAQATGNEDLIKDVVTDVKRS